MKKKLFVFYSLMLIILFLSEILILKYFSANIKILLWIVVFIFVIELGFWFLIKREKKNIYFFRSFLMSVKADVISLYGILLVVYFIIHMAWIPDYIYEFMNTATIKSEGWIKITFYFEFLFFPFLVVALTYKEVPRSIAKDKRKVLISAISLIPGFPRGKREGGLNDEEKHTLNTIDVSKDWNRWNPIRQALDDYPNFESIILLGSKETGEQLRLINQNDNFKKVGITHLIKEYSPNIKYVIIKSLPDFNQIESIYNSIKLDVLASSSLKNYDDEDIIFAVTGGTAIMSAAMTMHAVKGQRGIVYTRQDNRQLEEFNLSIFNFNELVNELIEKI